MLGDHKRQEIESQNTRVILGNVTALTPCVNAGSLDIMQCFRYGLRIADAEVPGWGVSS